MTVEQIENPTEDGPGVKARHAMLNRILVSLRITLWFWFEQCIINLTFPSKPKTLN